MLSKKEIENTVKATEKPQLITVHTDGYGEGALMLRILPGKRKKTTTWIGSLMRDGKQKRETIGRYPDMAPADALAALRDLVVESKKDSEGPVAGGSVKKLFECYLDNLEGRDARSVPEVRRLLLTGKRSASVTLGADREAKDITPGRKCW